MPSLRKATRQQFADGTTIDGNRIDRAMQDLADRWNAVQPSDLQRRWLPSYFVLGYQGQSENFGAFQVPRPWCDIVNQSTSVVGATPSVGIQNSRRLKGTYVGGVADAQIAWTISVHFIRPCILRNFHATFHTPYAAAPAEFTNDWTWAAPLAPGRVLGDPPNDVVIEVQIDSPFTREVRSETDSEVLRGRFELDAQFHAPAGMANHGHVLDGAPSLVGIKPDGVSIVAEGLNVPIPRESRVRFSISIPVWDLGAYGAPWGDSAASGAVAAWETQFYSGGLTVLEAIE